jgi:hypothetical protein
MSDAILGYGIVYEIASADSPGTWDELGEVTDIELPSDETEEVDVTHYQSLDRTREFLAGLINPGEASFTINWIPGNATDLILRALRVSGDTRQHRITFSSGVSVTFPAFIKGYAPSAPIDDRLSAQFTIKKAGAEVWDDTP